MLKNYLNSSTAYALDCTPMVVLKKCEPELSYILDDFCLSEVPFFQIFRLFFPEYSCLVSVVTNVNSSLPCNPFLYSLKTSEKRTSVQAYKRTSVQAYSFLMLSRGYKREHREVIQ